MAIAFLQDTLSAWPAATVRDTVAAITQDPTYTRVTSRSLWEEFLGWVARMIGAFFSMLPPIRSANFLIVVLAAVLIALIIARIVLQARARREYWAGERRESRLGRAADPWTEAERLAASGAFLDAAHHLFAALLAASARRGELTLHPAKTTGDYARELRRRGAPSEPAFQRFRARYDRVVYDAQSCSASDYARLVEEARPLLMRERAA